MGCNWRQQIDVECPRCSKKLRDKKSTKKTRYPLPARAGREKLGRSRIFQWTGYPSALVFEPGRISVTLRIDQLVEAFHLADGIALERRAVEEQATDRAHRIGQTKSVQVHRLIAEGTIEDRIASIHDSKRELADAIVSSGESALTELSNEDLADLVELRNAG